MSDLSQGSHWCSLSNAWTLSWFDCGSGLLVVIYFSSDSFIHSGYGFRLLFLVLYFFTVAIACPFSQSSVGVPLYSMDVSLLCIMGGSSIEYALASTVSSKRRRGVSSFLAHQWALLSRVGRNDPSFVLVGCGAQAEDRWQSWLRSSDLPFWGFAASIAFECIACVVVGLPVTFSGLLPLVPLHFPTVSLKVAELFAIEAVPLFGLLGTVFSCFSFSVRLGGLYLI